MVIDIKQALQKESNAQKAAFFPRFFKTSKGEYGEGDVFIGVTVPKIRAIVKIYRNLPMPEIRKLLADPIHEYRLAALLILVDQYQRGDTKTKKRIVDFYLKNLAYVNNWDLVDSSAATILGAHLYGNNTSLLTDLAQSKNLWKQRIAMVATFYFIRKNDFSETYRIADLLLHHKHDLIHKAVGWMLREAGKRDRKALEAFLKTRASTMPRTMLRYAIEKFEEPKRQKYLQMKVR